MVTVKYLWQHNKSRSWFYRRQLPPDVQQGKQIRQNLNTKSASEAAKLVLELTEKTDREIAQVRSGRKFTDQQLEPVSFAWGSFYQEQIQWSLARLPDELSEPVRTEAELDESILRFLRLNDYPIQSGSTDFTRLRQMCFEIHYLAFAVQPPLTKLEQPAPDFKPMVIGDNQLAITEH